MKKLVLTACLFAACAATAEIMDRDTGIRIGQRMIIRPYVSFFFTWDSNVSSQHDNGDAASINIAPGATLTYRGENWSVSGGGYYQYHSYLKNAENLNNHSFGQNFAYNLNTSRGGGKGWQLVLREDLQWISQDDDLTNDGGKGLGRDRQQVRFSGSLQRRFTDKWHADVDASYYYLNYDNDEVAYTPMYGWTRWTAGAQVGYAASQWTDFVLSGNYQGYTQDNNVDLGRESETGTKSTESVSGDSRGYTLHVGVGSRASEKISYHVSGGMSHFEYGDVSESDGFTYTVSGHWRMTDRWNMMLLASSYYHPSETEYGASARTDSFSFGLAHSMVRSKLSATLDLTYRHLTRGYTSYSGSDYTDDVITGRFGLNYRMNRFFSIFGNVEYQSSFCRGGDTEGDEYDYNRFRGTLGVRLTY